LYFLGDITPTTIIGRFIASCVCLLGIIATALPISIISSNFNLEYDLYIERKHDHERLSSAQNVIHDQIIKNKIKKMKVSAASNVTSILNKYRLNELNYYLPKRSSFRSRDSNDGSTIASQHGSVTHITDIDIAHNDNNQNANGNFNASDVYGTENQYETENSHVDKNIGYGVLSTTSGETINNNDADSNLNQSKSKDPRVSITPRDILDKYGESDSLSPLSSKSNRSDTSGLTNTIPWYVYNIIKIPPATIEILEFSELLVLFNELKEAYKIVNRHNNSASDKLRNFERSISGLLSRKYDLEEPQRDKLS